MHRFPRIFTLKKQRKKIMDPHLPDRKSRDHQSSPSRRLVRRNAGKHYDYAPTSLSASGSSSSRTRSLDLPCDANSTSFRIEGKDGDLASIYERLGLNGPEDLEIPKEAYDLMKSNSSPPIIQQPMKDQSDLLQSKAREMEMNKFVEPLPHRFGNGSHTVTVDEAETNSRGNDRKQNAASSLNINVNAAACNGGGIRGDRPSLLKPSLPLDYPPDEDDGDTSCFQHRAFSHEDVRELGFKDVDGGEPHGARIGETVMLSGSCSFSTTIDDDSSSSTTETVSIISPNSGGRFIIKKWEKGLLLGRGSFGAVYEGYAREGFFFAAKEVSLLEQGSQGKQSVRQLEQEIELLSQFKHENIVQYLGTDKVDSNLYIFLEIVTQGSLASNYQKYHLRDSHASAYTRQILLGLEYLHDRKVVHRDIKCANILVASNGTVKLADFGLAKATRSNDLKSCKGTPFWMAPEVLHHENQGYGSAADIWSLGCTVLEMLTRQVPYYPLESQQALYKIFKGEPPPIPNSISSDARDFIQQCLRVNPIDRPTAADLLNHPFVQRPIHGSESPMIDN